MKSDEKIHPLVREIFNYSGLFYDELEDSRLNFELFLLRHGMNPYKLWIPLTENETLQLINNMKNTSTQDDTFDKLFFDKSRDLYELKAKYIYDCNKNIFKKILPEVYNKIIGLQSSGKLTMGKSRPKKAKSTFRSGDSQGKDMIRNMNRMTGTTLKRFQK